jgi:endonuclease/exonuclease/phosphatase family metal-dependent hydrolase
MGSSGSKNEKYKCRIISLNMQMSFSDKWIELFNEMINGWYNYVLCLQEVNRDMITLLINVFHLKLHRHNNLNNTCVLISGNFPNDVEIDSIHLSDIPAPLHLLNKLYYEGHSQRDYFLTLDQIIEWSSNIRIPEIEPYLINHFEKKSIICGDFNETKGWPVSKKMKEYGYNDLGENVDKKTWPAYPFYQGEPCQRIDFIYARGVRLIKSGQFYKRKNWQSDHVAVFSDVFLS